MVLSAPTGCVGLLKPRSGRQGFTLIELMTVMIIMAMMMAIAVGAYLAKHLFVRHAGWHGRLLICAAG